MSSSVSAFSEGRDAYACVDAGALKVWDVASNTLKGEYKRHDHLIAEYTCIAWVQPAAAPGAQRGLGHVVLGRKDGTLSVWDLQLKTMTVASAASASYQLRVHGVAFGANAGAMYSCSDAPRVLSWTLGADGETWSSRRSFNVGERGATQLCVSADGQRVATARSSIDLWDIASGAKICSFAGHADVVRCLAFSHDGKYVVSGAEDRFLSVWAVAETLAAAKQGGGSKSAQKKKGKKRKHADTVVVAAHGRVAARTLVANAQPLSIAVRACGKAQYRLLAVTSDGDGLVWDLDGLGAEQSGAARPPSTADCRISVASAGRGNALLASGRSAAGAMVMRATFASANARTVVVAQGRALDPTFSTKSIVGDGAAQNNVLPRVVLSAASGARAGAAAKAAAAPAEAAKGAESAAHLVGALGAATRDVHLEQRAAKRIKTSGAAGAGAELDFSSVRDFLHASGADALENGSDDEEGEQPDADIVLGDRVEALSQELSADILQQSVEEEALANAPAGAGGELAGDAKAPPASLSMSAVLDQALQSGDNAMLEYCLAVQTQPVRCAQESGTAARAAPRSVCRALGRAPTDAPTPDPLLSLLMHVWYI